MLQVAKLIWFEFQTTAVRNAEKCLNPEPDAKSHLLASNRHDRANGWVTHKIDVTCVIRFREP
jgi:hypothetical protein